MHGVPFYHIIYLHITQHKIILLISLKSIDYFSIIFNLKEWHSKINE